ncbi:MAG: glycosyltransferase family 39 protein [Planctomycetaceae bacterium]|jgi:4-amino-4-deoxy-L-arabinose transferase-like glycosyltransferase|nr:glycosyltransferase family 39 protein [Planctomycetaceae bacterium]
MVNKIVQQDGKMIAIGGILFVHLLLLIYSATIHSPTNGEIPALSAGLYHWQTGEFNLFRVNPPLVRMVAALPVLFCKPKTDWSLNHDILVGRDEFPVGNEFIRLNGENSFRYFTLARLFCIPFSILGAVVCYRFGKELYGTTSGFIALILWCFSPTVLGHASTIGPDAHAAACGLLAVYLFWHWLQSPTVSATMFSGFALGLAELTKTTWLVLFPVWILLWLFWRMTNQNQKPSVSALCSILLIGMICINIGYGGERVFQPLGSFRFISKTFGGADTETNNKMKGKNRFRGTILEKLPVPFPQNYLLGIDIQRSDFEFHSKNYLCGKWKYGGWWYYYLSAFVVKEPVALSLFILFSLFVSYKLFRQDEIILLLPAVVIFILVSSQTGMNQHYRYVLGAIPFLFVFIAKLGTVRRRLFGLMILLLLTFYCGSSLAVFPHSLSYFNEAAGGSISGRRYLLGSNLEWGQDILLLKKWIDNHPECHPIFVSQSSYFDIGIAGIQSEKIPDDITTPGWYAVGVNDIHDREKKYRYFLRFEPVGMIGYSIYIYHMAPDATNKLRGETGLPE